jgi:hypothetical protein
MLKYLAALAAVLTLVLAGSAQAMHASQGSSVQGYVFWGNGNNGPAPGATVFINSSCGNKTTHSASSGYFPNTGGGVVLSDFCTYSIYASSGGCTVWYSDTAQFFTNHSSHYYELYLRHSVRVCGQPIVSGSGRGEARSRALSGNVSGICLNRTGSYTIPCSADYYQNTGANYVYLGSTSAAYHYMYFPYSGCGTVFAHAAGQTRSAGVCPGGFWSLTFNVP